MFLAYCRDFEISSYFVSLFSHLHAGNIIELSTHLKLWPTPPANPWFPLVFLDHFPTFLSGTSHIPPIARLPTSLSSSALHQERRYEKSTMPFSDTKFSTPDSKHFLNNHLNKWIKISLQPFIKLSCLYSSCSHYFILSCSQPSPSRPSSP